MALSTQERTSIIKLTVTMFNGALGAAFLTELTNSFESNGRDLAKLARDMAATNLFRSINPPSQSPENFAATLLIPLGLQGDSVAFEFVLAKFRAGVDKGQIVYDAMVALNNTTAPQYASAKALLDNKTAVSDYYTVTKPTTSIDLPTLKQLLTGVTPDPASIPPATTGPVSSSSAPAPAPLTLVLTACTDTMAGADANDTFTATTATLQPADSLDGAGGTDTLNYTNTSAAALPAATIKNIEIVNVNATSNLNSTDLSGLTGLTKFNGDRATATITATNAAAGVQYGLIGDNTTLSPGSFNFGYGAGATVETLNLQNGVKSNAGTNVFLTGASVTSTVINSTGAANSLSTAGTAGVIVTAASSTSITINASTDLTGALSSTNDTKLTVTGSGVVDLRGVNYGFSLNKNIITIDASAQTTGGTLVQAGNPANASTLKFIGGGGNDAVGLGTALTAGASLDGGGGTDTIRTNNATFITGVTGAFIKNFEVVDIAANITVDLDHLSANNTLTGQRLGGASNVVNNVSATVGANVTVYASGSPNLNL